MKNTTNRKKWRETAEKINEKLKTKQMNMSDERGHTRLSFIPVRS